jgi:zinc protease
MPGQTPETLEKELLAELERLRTEPVAPEELARAKNQVEAAFVFQEDSVHRRASLLARFELTGGWRQKDTYLQKVRAVTADDIQRVARAYFLDSKKNVGYLIPIP